jgi:Rrf2 family nitric oxide-sensitive transcriptional repressor
MKLQQATRCAIWAIIELASRPGEPISAEKLAETYGISQSHLAKVLRTLTRAKSVASVRRPGGGFVFCGNAKRLTLFDIISLFEDEWTVQATNLQRRTNDLAH